MSKHLEYFKDCAEMDKKEAIEHVVNTYGIKRNTAATYYALWQNFKKKEEEKAKWERDAAILGVVPDNSPIVKYNIKDKITAPELGTGWVPVPEKDLELEDAEEKIFAIIATDDDPQNDMGFECENEDDMKEYADKCRKQGYEVEEIIKDKSDTVSWEEVKERMKTVDKPEIEFLPIVIGSGHFTYRLSPKGMLIEESFHGMITESCIAELTAALGIWDKYYGGAVHE